MTVLSRLADRLILCPTNGFVDPEGKKRIDVPVPGGLIEIWVANTSVAEKTERDVLILKFPGTAGRAERAGTHPAEVWRGVSSEIWAVNNAGYGGSSGAATIKSFPDTATAVYEFARKQFSGLPIVVVGNSLGCLSSLFLAARHDVAALMLRNPPPIKTMIRSRPRYSWWNLGLSRWIASEIPDDLDAIENASRSKAPCLFIQSEKDRVVPTKYQDLIIDRYSGEKMVFCANGADHHHHVPEDQHDDYLASIDWLGKRVGASE